MAVALDIGIDSDIEVDGPAGFRERLANLSRLPGLWPVLSCSIVVAIWEVASLFTKPAILPGPGDVISGLVQLANLGVLGSDLAVSLREMYIGLLVGGGAGLLIGIFIGVFKKVDRVFQPYLNIANAIPGLIIIPWFVIIFGLGLVSRSAFIIYVTFFPMAINARAGVLAAGQRFTDLGKVFHLNKFQTVTRLVLPASVPYLFIGLKLSLGLALISMIVAELEMSYSGVGYLIANLASSFQTAKVIGVVLVTSAIGVVQVGVVRFVETRWLSWMRWA